MSTRKPESKTVFRWDVERWLDQSLPARDGEAASNWDAARLLQAEDALREIGAALGVLDSTEADPAIIGAERYQWLVIEQAIQAEVRRLASCWRSEWPGFAFKAKRGTKWEMLSPGQMTPKVNANSCTARELDALPGLGMQTAERIVRQRESEGPFANRDDIRRAAGVSESVFQKAEPFLTLGPAGRLALPAVTRQIDEEGRSALVGAVVSGQLDVEWTSARDKRDVLLDTLEQAAAGIAQRANRPRFWTPSPRRLVRAAIALDLRAVRRAARQDAAEPRTENTSSTVSPVPSSAYLPLLESLIASAKERIWCSMFFFHVEGEDSPGGRIVAALKAASGRGVDVRLILDHDLPGDYHNARSVNENAFAAMSAAGLAVRPSHPDVTLHGKAVAIDSNRVLAGSHNWTSSSFYRYEETTLLVESTQLNEQVVRQHERQWQLLAEKPQDRVVELSVLELLDPWQKAAADQAKVRTGEDLVRRARLISGRRKLGELIGMAEDGIEKLRDVVVLMKAFRISETTALTLVWHGLDTVAQVRRAPRAEIELALREPSPLPEPFRLRRIPAGLVDYLWKHN